MRTYDLTPKLTKALAKAKALSLKLLLSLGIKDCPGGISIPYKTQNGGLSPRHRIRRGLSSKDGFLWTGQGEIIPYGLWKIDGSKFLILVEGESDCWSLWHHDYPALGLPGSSTSKILTIEHLDGIHTLYVWREPDRGGELFVSGIAKRLYEIGFHGKAKILEGSGYKDPSE